MAEIVISFAHAGSALYAFITDRNFISAFFANLFVGVIAVVVLPWYLDRRKIHDSEIYLCEAFTRKREFPLSRASDGGCETTLRLSMKNASPFSLRDLYINLFIPPPFAPVLSNQIGEELISLTDIGGGYHRLYYKMKGPVYPDRFHNFSFDLQLKTSERSLTPEALTVNYYVSTEVGVFPKSAGFINDENATLTIENLRDNSARLRIIQPQPERSK